MSLRERFSQHLQRAWRERGPLAVALLPLAALFGIVAATDRALYRLGWKATVRLPVPVVVVGNLIVGGAGKTPTVIAVVELLRRRGFAPGVVSRGWGRGDDAKIVDVGPDAPASAVGDEPLLLRRRTGVPVCVGRDRVAAARTLLARHPAVDVIVSDDGRQHRRLGRDVDILVFDERGTGNGWLLPAGPLRETLPHRVPPGTLVLYNAAVPSTRLPGHVARRGLHGVVALADWHGDHTAMPMPIGQLQADNLVAVAGLAHPQRFFSMLSAAGLRFDALALDDHHDYAHLPWPPGTPDVITTEKDAVKLDPARMGSTRVWVAALDFSPADSFGAELLDRLQAALRSRRALAATASDHGNTPS